MQALTNFKCRSSCKHKECQRHANLGIIDRNQDCDCVQEELTGSSIFLENVIDMANTLAQIFVICGIHECKAKTAVDIITYAFLHYDLVCYCLDAKPSKRLRKEDVFHELGRKCLMNRVEAHLCYTIIKRGFKAFYYRPQDEELSNTHNNDNNKSSISDQCIYVHAAKKTAESFAHFDGLSCVEQRGVEAKIRVAYKKFYDRMQSRKAKPEHIHCNCCFCAKKRGHLVYGTKPPCSQPKQNKKHSCPHCCRKKKAHKLIHSRTPAPICPVCNRSRKFCTCDKYQFDINWIQSIWARPDMNLYYMENIEKAADNVIVSCHNKGDSENDNVEEENEPKADQQPDADDANKHNVESDADSGDFDE